MSAVAEAEPQERAVELPAPSLEVPRVLPVRSLSASSLAKWERCQATWKTSYIDRRFEPQKLNMTAGKAYGGALAAYFKARIDGESMSAADADDRLLAEFDQELRETKLYSDDDPEKVREQCREPLRVYLEAVAPEIRPVAVERTVRARFPGAEWSFVGYPDLETEDGLVIDYKLGEKHVFNDRAHKDVQVRSYLLCRWLEGHPARFAFHSARLGEIKSGPRLKAVPEDPVGMTRKGLVLFQARIARAAREIARAFELDEWDENPHGWWCNSHCPAHATCPGPNLT